MQFEQWLENLDALFAEVGVEGSYVAQTGAECWREMFDDEMTPDEAFDAEMDAWRWAA